MWKVLLVIAITLLIVAAVFAFMFFSGERERAELRKRNVILERQSAESRRIALENLRRIDRIEADNGRLNANLEQLRADNQRLIANHRTVTAELERYKNWIAEYFGTTGDRTSP